jgi:hypothetical protein
MQLQARLVHADAQGRIVLVTALEGDRVLGSALGEAPGAEEAEDRARTRLLARLEVAPEAGESMRRPATPTPTPLPSRLSLPPAFPAPEGAARPAEDSPAPEPPATSAAPPALAEAPPDADSAPAEPPVDPEDWSAELAQLDLQLQRLGWSREQEAIYLQRAFGHPSRNRLTTYADLLAYLRAVEGFAPQMDPATAAVPLRRGDLLRQCDQLLEGLGWGAEQGRAFLQDRLGAGSRRQLGEQQLLQFNMLLEEQLMGLQGGESRGNEGHGTDPC